MPEPLRPRALERRRPAQCSCRARQGSQGRGVRFPGDRVRGWAWAAPLGCCHRCSVRAEGPGGGGPGGAELAHTTLLATGGAGVQIQVPRIQIHGPRGLLPVSPERRRERTGGCLQDATQPGWDTRGPDLGLNSQPTVGFSTLQSFFRA